MTESNNVALLWTADCTGPFDDDHSSTDIAPVHSSYTVQKYFSLRYYPHGGYQLIWNAESYEVPANSLFCIPPNTKYAVNPTSKAHGGYYDIIFIPNDPYLGDHVKRCLPLRTADSTVTTMLDYIIHNWHRQDFNIQNACESFLHSLLLLFFMPQEEVEQMGSQFILTENYSNATHAALNYIEKNYYHRFSLDDLAKEVGYNKSYLCTKFAKDTGISIVTYSSFLRIRKAIGTILFSPRSFKEIASAFGFDNTTHFSQLFKSFVGVTPRDFNSAARRLSPEEISELYAAEPLLNYQRHSIAENLQSMRHIGDRFKALCDE